MKDDSLEEKLRLYGKRKQHCAENGFPYRRKKQAKMESFSLYWGKINRSVFAGRINTLIPLAFAIYFHFPTLSFGRLPT